MMATTATREAKARKTHRGPKSTTSARKVEANQRNALKSTGPRTPEGKGKSSLNALTHGESARSVLLPGDDPAALNALRTELLDNLQPRNSLEAMLIVCIAEDRWICDRSRRSTERRVAMRARNEPSEQAKAEKVEALELGEKLFWNLSRPMPMDLRSLNTSVGQPPHGDVSEHPIHPDRVRLALEQTLAGCDWLLDRWREIDGRLNGQDPWQPADAFKMVRLMGKHAADMDEDFDVARVLMSSLTLTSADGPEAAGKPIDWPRALCRMMASFGFEGRDDCTNCLLQNFISFIARLTDLPLAKMAPANSELARQWLNSVVTGEFHRIQEIRATLQAIADSEAAEAPERLWFETGPEGENSRRYMLSHKRVLNRSVGMLLSARTKAEAGEFDRIVGESPVAGLASDALASVPARTSGPIAGKEISDGVGDTSARAPEREEPAAPELRQAPRAAHPGGVTLNLNRNLPGTCGEDSILRNEAKRTGGGPACGVDCRADRGDTGLARSVSGTG